MKAGQITVAAGYLYQLIGLSLIGWKARLAEITA